MALADFYDAVAAAEVIKAIAYANARRTQMLASDEEAAQEAFDNAMAAAETAFDGSVKTAKVARAGKIGDALITRATTLGGIWSTRRWASAWWARRIR